MKNSFRNLHYYGMTVDFNDGSVKYVDVFDAFEDNIFDECLHKYNSIKNYADLQKWVRSILRDTYSAKTEYEMLVSNVVNNETSVETNIWKQVEPNLEIIVDMINNAFELGYEKQ